MSKLKRILAVTRVRNLEFLRDRSSVGWNVVLPILLVFGLALIFSSTDHNLFKVAVLCEQAEPDAKLHPFLATQHVQFFRVEQRETYVTKVSRHQADMLLDLRPGERAYWVNRDSPKGYVLERMLLGTPPPLQRHEVQGAEVRYVDWLLPGILGMNMMFSCLFGVGYVIVRYRKSGYLKRLNATPLTAFEFICAQVLSRLLLIMVITAGIFVSTHLFIGFRMDGSYLDLFVVALLGATCLISLGLTIAAQVASEELADGLLNVLTWPMMLMSGVWFSLEGAPGWVQRAAEFFPLTQLLTAVRAIMLDGAGLWEVRANLAVLLGMTAAFLLLGASWFRWRQE